MTAARPTVSFLLLGYRQQKFIRAAIRGAFAQDYGPLEIILSDDASPDGTFAAMEAAAAEYRGPHRVIARRNRTNLGLAAHVNALMRGAAGEVIVFAGGDDISHPSRVSTSVALLQNHAQAGEVLMSARTIDSADLEIGRSRISARVQDLQTLDTLLAWRHRTLGAGRTMWRRVFDSFGPLQDECPSEDVAFLLRSLILGGSVVTRRVGLDYRHHAANLSNVDGMRRMDVAAIHDQYQRDITTALSQGLLNHHQAARLDAWMEEDGRVRRLRQKIVDRKPLTLPERWSVLRAPGFSARHRLRGLRP